MRILLSEDKKKADKLVLGHIVTLDPRNPILEAMTVVDGKVQYAGSLNIARQLCDENTEIMDYTGKYVYPCFIEGHCHGAMAGPRLAFFANLTDGQSIEDYSKSGEKTHEHKTVGQGMPEQDN